MRSPLVLSLVWGAIAASPVAAQIVPDTSLPQNAIVTPNGDTFTIDGGTAAGENLFHSFSEFSVPTGTEAFFNNAVEIDNIITRVTGGSISNIDGLIRANGTANLFLLNPNGIVFGENARLDVGGAVWASSADRLLFADGVEFNTTGATTGGLPLLSVNVPVGLQFNEARSSPGSIQVNGNGHSEIRFGDADNFPNVDFDLAEQLQATFGIEGNLLTLNNGRAIALIGRDITFNGGGIRVPQGDVNIASIASGRVDLSGNPLDNNVTFGDIRFQNGAAIDTSGNSSGDVVLRGENVIFSGNSVIFARPLGTGTGSDVTIEATGNIGFQNSGIVGGTLGSAQGTHIHLQGEEIAITDGGFLSATSFSDGNGGNIDLFANAIEISGTDGNNVLSAIFADAAGSGTGGTIRMEGDRLRVADGGQVTARSLSSGHGGNLDIDVANIELSGSRTSGNSPFVANVSRDRFPSGLFAIVESGATGNSGNIDIDTNAIALTFGGQIAANTLGAGNAGNLTIRATDSMDVIGASANGLTRSSLSGTVRPGATGNGGNISIDTGRLRVLDTAFVSVTTFGDGNAGDLSVRADAIELRGASATNELIFGGLFAEVRGPDRISGLGLNGEAEGSGGDVTLEADRVSILDGAHISVLTDSVGNAGNLTIITQNIDIGGVVEVPTANPDNPPFTRATISAGTEETGLGGTVTIATGDLQVRDGGRISVSTEGTGNAGDLTVRATGTIAVSGQFRLSTANVVLPSTISASSSSLLDIVETGNAGTLRLEAEVNAGTIRLQDGGRLNAESIEGDRGNIRLTADNLVLLNSSLVTTDASQTATGGNISIDSELVVLDDSSVTANAIAGRGGNIQIQTRGLFVSPGSAIEASSQFGVDGIVEIETPDVDNNAGLVNLKTDPLNATALIFDPCRLYADSEFIVTGRGGIPENPRQFLEMQTVLEDFGELQPLTGDRGEEISPTTQDPLPREATNWTIAPTGEIMLVSDASTETTWHQPTCHFSDQ